MRSNTPAEINSEAYDDYVEKYTKPWNDFLINRISEELLDNRILNGTLLDVGTGTARTLIDMALMPGFNKFKFEGVDYFHDMVAKANTNIHIAGLADRIKVAEGDVHQMNYSNDSFDVVIGRSVIHHWANPEKAYQEIYRVLKPAGIAIIHEPCREPEQDALEIFNEARRMSGIHNINLKEKFTTDEILNQLISVTPPAETGPSSYN